MSHRSVLVTGASTGIGYATARRLSRDGWHVFAGVRKQADAARLVESRSPGTSLTPVMLDITDAASVNAAAGLIDDTCGRSGLDAVVNNAGIAIAGPLEFLPIDALVRQLDVNVTGQVRMTQQLMPALRRANGRIVFVGSIAGRSALPFTGAYCASKFALEAIADSWRIELRPWNIYVSIIEPGVIMTPIWETATRAADDNLARMPAEVNTLYGRALDGLRRRIGSMKGRQPDDVAIVIQRALDARRPRPRYVVGMDARSRLVLGLLPDRIRDAVVSAGVRAMSRTPASR